MMNTYNTLSFISQTLGTDNGLGFAIGLLLLLSFTVAVVKLIVHYANSRKR